MNEEDNDKLELIFNNVSLDLPNNGERLVDKFNLTLNKGDRLIITGPSGCGKSSLIRAAKNIWRDMEGEITLPIDKKILVLTQKVDLPRTSLRGILSSPELEGHFSDKEIDQALREAGLEKLTKHLPLNQAKPDYIYRLMEKYIPLATKHWCKDIKKFSTAQRETLINNISDYIKIHAENFFEDDLKPYITFDTKKSLAEKVTTGIEKKLEQELLLPEFNSHSFDVTLKKLATKISKYLLQGAAIDIKESYMDGSDFAKQLSGGEQQRISFAQAFLHKPPVIFMDETTAALDKNSGETLYKKLIEKLSDSIIISVAHNTHIMPFHTHHAHLENQTITVKKIKPAAPAR